MNELAVSNYNFEKTLLGGQAFNWDKINDSYYGFTSDKIIKLKPEVDKLYWQTFPSQNNETFIKQYLNLDVDYKSILREIIQDEHVAKAFKSVGPIRLLNQDFEQTLLSFILSSHKNIKAIRKIVRDLSKKYGERIIVEGIEFHTFPKAQVLVNLSESELRSLGMGFRAKYFQEALKALLAGELKESEPQAIAQKIKNLKGIGDKIADCIAVFSLGLYDRTPLDIWAKRALVEFYGVDSKLNYHKMSQWYASKFKNNTAWAGQLLFEYIRLLKR